MRPVALAIAAVALLAPPAGAQSIGPGGTVPVVANLPGVGGTFWRSDVAIANTGVTDTTVMLKLYPEIRDGAATFETKTVGPLTVAAGAQLTLANVVKTRFGLVDAKGALQVYTTDGTPVALASRTYTYGNDGGSYGQDVSGVLVANRAWVSGLEHDSLYRTNIGIFWLWSDPATFTVTVFNADGSEAGSGTVTFTEAGLQQKSLTAFGVGTLLDGYAVITCDDPGVIWYAYGSRVDQISGDAVYRPARGLAAELP